MNPWIILAFVLSLVGAAGSGFYGGKTYEGYARDSKEKTHVEQTLQQTRLNAAATVRRSDNVILAQNAASTRATHDRIDAANARAESDGLRSDLADARTQLANVPTEALLDAIATRDDLLGQCSARYSSLAEKSDRHVNDIKTLNEAWP